jgi:hypothetical protein
MYANLLRRPSAVQFSQFVCFVQSDFLLADLRSFTHAKWMVRKRDSSKKKKNHPNFNSAPVLYPFKNKAIIHTIRKCTDGGRERENKKSLFIMTRGFIQFSFFFSWGMWAINQNHSTFLFLFNRKEIKISKKKKN